MEKCMVWSTQSGQSVRARRLLSIGARAPAGRITPASRFYNASVPCRHDAGIINRFEY
jgi:hypothetical protein